MTNSTRTIGTVVLGILALTAFGCADVGPVDTYELECSEGDNGSCTALVMEPSPDEAYPIDFDVANAVLNVQGLVDPENVAISDVPAFDLHESRLNVDLRLDIDSDHAALYNVEPTYKENVDVPDQSDGPCPEEAVDPEGFVVCLETVNITELPNGRAVYECVYGDCD